MNTSDLLEANNSFVNSSQMIWSNVMNYLPKIAFAVLFLVVGLVVASLLGKLVTRIIKRMKLDRILTTTRLNNKLKDADIHFTISGVLGWVVKWFIIIAVLLTISGMLELDTVSVFLTEVLLYIPNVVVAIVILTIGLVVGNFVSELIGKSISTTEFLNAAATKTLKVIAKWIIIFFAIMAALAQLNIAPQLIQVLFTGIVMTFSLAGGIAFGLGGKDRARELLDNILSK